MLQTMIKKNETLNTEQCHAQHSALPSVNHCGVCRHFVYRMEFNFLCTGRIEIKRQGKSCLLPFVTALSMGKGM